MKKIIFNQTPPNSGIFFPPLWKKVGGGEIEENIAYSSLIVYKLVLG